MPERLSHFGGVAADVLGRTLRRSTWLSGMTLVSALFLSARGLGSIEQLELFPLAALLLVSLGLAHHGVHTAAAHTSRFGPADGRTLVVATRLVIVSAVWFVPWMLWGAALGPELPILDAVGIPSPMAAGLFLFGCLIATPACLIAAVHSEGWVDVLSPLHWSRQFSGRGADLMTAYTIQAGGATLVTALMIPLVFGAIRINATVGFAAAGVAACVVLGYWVALTGRLCGSIHAQPASVVSETPELEFEHSPAFPSTVSDSDLNRDLPERPVEQEQEQEQESEPVATELRNEPDRLDEQKIPATSSEPINPRRYAAPSQPVEFNVPKTSEKARNTPLLDAENRVAEAMKRFRLDPSHTLSRLAELNQNFAPNAHVLQSLTICLHRTGHTEQAFQVARQAFPRCFECGHVSLAAAMFYELRSDLTRLELKEKQVLEIATVLHRADELAAAAKAYSLVIHANPREIVAVKGLLDLAERIHQVKGKPAAALKIYMFLLDHCNDPGMTAIIQEGIAQCRDAEEAAANAELPEVPA